MANRQARARIFLEGTKVLEVDGKRKSGEWSRRMKIVAMFLDPDEAEEYAEVRMKRTGRPNEVRT